MKGCTACAIRIASWRRFGRGLAHATYMSSIAALLLFVPLSAVAFVACGAGSDPDTAQPADPASTSTSPPATALQQGTIVDVESGWSVPNALVRVGDATTTTDQAGNYALPVETRAPFATLVSAAGYLPVTDQWTVLNVSADRSPTPLFSTARADAILGALDSYDATLGVLLIQVVAIGDCKAISGAQISASQANAKVAYFSAGLPQAGRTYAAGVGIPSAIVYNLVPGAAVDVTVVSPWCATADRPVTLDNVTYYEVVPVAAGTLAFERVFIGRVPPESIPSN